MNRTSTGASDAEEGIGFHVSARTIAVLVLTLAAGVVACRVFDADRAPTAALKVVGATLAVGMLPGMLATLLWQPRPRISVLELMGWGIGISFSLAHLLTILAVSAHLDGAVILGVLLIGATLMAGVVIRRSSCTIVVSLDELIVLALLVVLGWSLYMVGAPVDNTEDQIHASIARRLSQLASPRFDNLYAVPGIVYTYPFPGTHYFIGLIARLGDIDALFVYHKLRFFWGSTALLMLYLMARVVFGTRAIACACVMTAVVLVCSGIFAMGFPSGWGQLVPYSHASDIAMTVLLPSLLVLVFSYLQADTRREQVFFFGAAGLLTLMLTMVHIREIVQLAAYLGCFVVVTAVSRAFRVHLRRAIAMLGLVLAVAALYATWQATMVPLVDDIVGSQRAELLSIAASNSARTLLLAPPTAVLGDYVQKSDQVFRDLLPFFLFTGPAVVLLFRRRPLVWLISSSILAYLIVMSVPLLALSYIYLTYFEILHIPVRNVFFFVCMFAGAPFYVAVVAMMRIDRTRLSPLVMGTAAGALGLLTALVLNQSHTGFFAPLIAAYGLTFVFIWATPLALTFEWRTVVVALVSTLALAALWPDHAPVPRSEQVAVRWKSELPDDRRRALEQQFSLVAAERKADDPVGSNTWDYRVTDLSIANIKALVTDAEAADTHFIDRSTYTVLSQPPLGDHLRLGMEYVRWVQYPGQWLLVVTAVLVWALGLLVPALLASSRGVRAIATLDAATREPFYRHAVPYALFIIPFVLWSARPTLSPLVTALNQPAGLADTPKAMLAQLPCLTLPRMQARFTEHLFDGDRVMLPERTICPPDAAVVEWMQTQVPIEAVFAIDRWDPYPPSMFTPQQEVVFPTLDAAFVNEDRLFSTYYRFFYERMRQYRVQPFFNAVETPSERQAFIKGIGVTHVLVGPAHYDELRPVLDRLPGQFTLRYDHARWAVYEVTGNAD